MRGPADIAELFGIFHDGIIHAAAAPHGDGEIVVEIGYLAKRVSPSGRSFMVRFDELVRMVFTPWEEPPRPSFAGLAAITPLELEILSAEVEGDSVEVTCGCQHPDTAGYGGSLEIIAGGCRVHDESGREWSLEELGKLADDYWEEWSSRGGAEIKDAEGGEGEVAG